METRLSWLALHVRGRREAFVRDALAHKGYEVFLPTYDKQTYGGSHPGMKEHPLFPGYLFCCFNPDLNGKIVTTSGVIRIVSFGETPAVVPQEEIVRIQ